MGMVAVWSGVKNFYLDGKISVGVSHGLACLETRLVRVNARWNRAV